MGLKPFELASDFGPGRPGCFDPNTTAFAFQSNKPLVLKGVGLGPLRNRPEWIGFCVRHECPGILKGIGRASRSCRGSALRRFAF